MKLFLFITLLMIASTSLFAAEVETDCPAMNENREKIFKPVKESSQSKTKTVQQ